MAAAAGSSLADELGRLRGLIDAATRDDPRSDEPVQSASARSSTRPPPPGFKPLLQHGIVPAVAGLLQHVLRVPCQSLCGLGTVPARLAVVCGAPSALVEGSKADQLYSRLTAVEEVAATVEAAASASDQGINTPGGGSAAAAVRAAAGELWGQLAAPATLQALADAVRWVEAEAWPAEHAMAAAVAGAGGPAQQPSAVGQGPAGTLQDFHRQGRARGVLASAAFVVRGAVIWSGSLLSPAEGAGAAAAAAVPAASAARQLALLAALRDSGVLSALSAAVLSAPPCPEVAADADALDGATAVMVTAQYHVFSALGSLSRFFGTSASISGCTELLMAPDVQRLRWAALEQLAAAAPTAADCSSSSCRDAADGGVRGVGGEAGARWLLLLLQPHVIRLHSGLGRRQVVGYASMMRAALDAPSRWLCGSQPLARTGAVPDTAAASFATVQRLLPPSRRLAALAAPCARTVCAEVEAELRALSADAAAASAGPGGGGAGGVGGSLSATIRRTYCLRVVELLGDLALILSTVATAAAAAADELLPDLLETCGWALRAQAVAMAVDGGGAAFREGEGGHMSPAFSAVPVFAALTAKLHGAGEKRLSAATQAACAQRLLPTGLMGSVDCLLRHLATAGLRSEDESDSASPCLFLLASTVLTSVIREQVAARPACGSDHGGSVWRPQDDLGLLITAAKLARPQAEQPSRVALVPHSNLDVLVLATGLAGVGTQMVTLLTGLTQQRQRGSSSAAALQRSAEAAVALREAIALASVTALPILERVVVRDHRGLGGSGGGHGGGGGGDGRVEELFPGGQSYAEVMAEPLTGSIAQDCRGSIALMVHCLAAAVQLLPPDDLLALQPQRTLALLGGLVQQAHELRLSGAGQGSRGSGRGGGGGRATSGGGRSLEDELPTWADEVAGALVHMAADEQLVGAVASWLRGEATALPQPAQAEAVVVPPQGLCGGLDARALAAALRHWNAAAAETVECLHAAAASSASAVTMEVEGGGGSSSSRGPAAAASSGGATAPLLAAARAAIALRHETALWGLRDGGAGGYPSWPPRVLRLCGNPACRNFAGPAEADLPLRKCSGCRAVRYCGAGCQRQHWREGGHREACARLRAATQAAKGGG